MRGPNTELTWTNPETGKSEPMGCGCYLPFKNWLRVRCWLHEKGIENMGWPVELDSEDPYE